MRSSNYGRVPGITFRFRKDGFQDNDGYWYADILFSLPANANGPALKIGAMGVDDRAVVELNGNIISDAGSNGPGQGYMTYVNGGSNRPRTFRHGSGLQNKVIRTGLVVGTNDLRIIVNNTGEDIYGMPIRFVKGSPTNVGIYAAVHYTVAGAR